MKILFICDPPQYFKIYKDTTYAMMRELARRNTELFYAPAANVFARGAAVAAEVTRLVVETRANSSWFTLQEKFTADLTEFSATLIRSDPPFNLEYLYLTQLATIAAAKGAKIFNSGQALRDFNEKLAILNFPQFIAPTLVTADITAVLAFLEQHRDIIVKPLDGMGGQEVFRLTRQDYNRHSILESLTRYSQRRIMAQKYIPEIKAGDKRVLIINGKPIDYALARMAQGNETRANLAAGGKGVAQKLTVRERQITEELGPKLKKSGILLAGLDIIGDYLTEINVTSPTGFQEITAQQDCDVAKIFVDTLCRQL